MLLCFCDSTTSLSQLQRLPPSFFSSPSFPLLFPFSSYCQPLSLQWLGNGYGDRTTSSSRDLPALASRVSVEQLLVL